MRAITWAAAATATVALALTGCGTSNSDGGIGGNSGNGDSYAGVVSTLDPDDRDQVLVGVGDDSHLPPPYLTITAGSKVAATCHGVKGAPPKSVTVVTTDGWKIELTRGSQTFTAENPSIEFPAGQITIPPQSTNEYLEEVGIVTGINWDYPSSGHVDVDITVHEDKLPSEWDQTPEFKMDMHINCGGGE
ncbi:hypothetical protein [Gordonia terrae]|uniref:hypothetical protein n=1 Tax=Gordonia terrae TaxID=2055 RepID=UPI003F6CE3B5